MANLIGGMPSVGVQRAAIRDRCDPRDRKVTQAQTLWFTGGTALSIPAESLSVKANG